ncbi:MAG: hypothetical protein BMS9Abin12_2136 [Acidimicrobiia bacterium]|nr:MAG: hypothetical protein BMS9Abin12_2136 [Acidimicrobiia bacterium]
MAGIAQSPIDQILDKWGISGLALGSLVFGPTLTLTAVLLLGLDRKRFFIHYTIVGGLATTRLI